MPVQPSASRRRALSPARPGTPGPGVHISTALTSLPREDRWTALGHRRHALLPVLGGRQPVLLAALAGEGGADPAGEVAAHRLADRAHGERRRTGDVGGEIARRLAHLVERHEAVGEAEAQRLVAIDAAPRVEQVERGL